MFTHLIKITPLGFLYGSAGAFLSPENLVGRSGTKFPPDAATLAGLIFSTNKAASAALKERQEKHKALNQQLFVAGPFWANVSTPDLFYVPMPRHKIIGEKGTDQWQLNDWNWKRPNHESNPDLEADYTWLRIDAWDDRPNVIQNNQLAAKSPWKYVPMLHPYLKSDERHVRDEDGLFLENAVQMIPNQWDGSKEDTCLVYLSTVAVEPGWYRFGGENHLVDVESIELNDSHVITTLLEKPIERAFALITPGIWGSNHLSLRYPRHPDFPKNRPLMLTDRPLPYRYRNGENKHLESDSSSPANPNHWEGRLSRGRYAVPSGTVYVFNRAIARPWSAWLEEWFPKEGFPLKHLGCNLCLPIVLEGVN
jgi:CRISPR-associated protein Cmr3